MTPLPPALAYRRAATQQASVVGLVIALYDTLAGDLQRAIFAMQKNQIEERCRQLKHGFTVLSQLCAFVDTERGGETAIHLHRFYGHLRQEMLRAQFTMNLSVLENAKLRLLDVRDAWHQVDVRGKVPSGDVSKAREAMNTTAPVCLDCRG